MSPSVPTTTRNTAACHYRGPRKVVRLFGERRSSGVSELFVLARKRAIPSLRRRATAICLVSAIPTAPCADIFGNLYCPKHRSWTLYSITHQRSTASCAASHSSLTGNGCTARNAVPPKHAASRPQPECVSTVKSRNKPQYNRFALGKPCTARLF